MHKYHKRTDTHTDTQSDFLGFLSKPKRSYRLILSITLLHSISVFVKIPVNKERLRVEELVILLEEVVEIFRPIRRGSLEGETGHRAETELALLRVTLNNCDKIV